jgi:predicted N-formylglutamate amidohydrolase
MALEAVLAAPLADPPVLTVLRPDGTSPFVLVCEHASNHIPAEYGNLGLPEAELSRHIAWDIGAEGLTRRLSELLDAPAFLAGWSRLLIDGNRPPGAPSSIPRVSEATAIPGNEGLAEAEIEARTARFFRPFHEGLARHLDQRLAAGRTARVVGVHSFTPVFLGVARPWHAGILFQGSANWGNRMVAALDRPDRPVVANEPYRIEEETDYLVPIQAERRGLEAILLEIRQDLLARPEQQDAWARVLAAALV